MATTQIPPRAPEAEVELDGGRLVTVRRVAPDDAASILVFLASPGVRFLCSGPGARDECGHIRAEGEPTAMPQVIAVSGEDDVLAAGWLAPAAAQGPARLAVAAHVGYLRGEVVIAVFRQLALEAVQRGFERFTTCVTSLHGQPFEELRAAGLRIESSFSLGGVTEVELSFE